MRALVRLAAGLAVAGVGLGCAAPAQRLAEEASARGFDSTIVSGAGFRHVVFSRSTAASSTLHVYLDGDGTPWRLARPAPDPTPRDPLVLDLMALDPGPSLYLGRPCYHGLAAEPPCESRLWTRARYAEEVVASLAAALRRLLDARGATRLVLFGHSGGGVLAMLLASRLPETAGVVTVAANLDVDAWADLHGYDRLDASLNPAGQPPLRTGIRQRHYAGGRDRIVPPAIVARGPVAPGTLRVIPDYDHRCCWREIWPRVLSDADP
jgi:acetyl esterase/lipase